MFYKIKELVVLSRIQLVKVNTKRNVTNVLTKVVTTTKFKHYLYFLQITQC